MDKASLLIIIKIIFIKEIGLKIYRMELANKNGRIIIKYYIKAIIQMARNKEVANILIKIIFNIMGCFKMEKLITMAEFCIIMEILIKVCLKMEL